MAAALLQACGPDDLPLEVLEQPIVGGSASPESFHPAVGALVVNHPLAFSSFCSATIIGNRHVLTAAHCIAMIPKGYPIGFNNSANTNNWFNLGKTLPIDLNTGHPSYTGGNSPQDLSKWYDIAVLRLKNATNITPIKLVRSTAIAGKLIKLGGEALIIGYGQTDSKNKNSAGIKHHGTGIIGQVGTGEIFLSGTGNPRKCFGDSGGPTLVNAGSSSSPQWQIVGVASRADQDCSYGSVETRVDVYLSWIHSVANSIPCGSGLNKDCGTQPPPPPKKKQFGESCSKSAECQSGLCLVVSSGAFCSSYCTVGKDTCPSNYNCSPISGTAKAACIKAAPPPPPQKKKFGEPCAQHGDCQSGICATHEGQKFCTKLCQSGQECGPLWDCFPAGVGQSACAPGSASGADTGEGDGCSISPGPDKTTNGFMLLFVLLLGRCLRTRRPTP